MIVIHSFAVEIKTIQLITLSHFWKCETNNVCMVVSVCCNLLPSYFYLTSCFSDETGW